MLVELLKLATFPGSPWLAQVRTPFGRASVRWCGDPTAEPGEYRVEWTIDETIDWLRNAKPAAGSGPEVRTGGHCVVLRGRLTLTEDGAALMDLDGTLILLDVADRPLPEEAADTWVELSVARDKITLHPFEL